MPKEYAPMILNEARHYADIAKRMTRDDAKLVERILLRRAMEVGGVSDEIMGTITSISEYFADEDRRMQRELIESELRRKGALRKETIDAEDNQIVFAIKRTLPKFKSERDWGGIYRILVDLCDFPSTKTDFVRSMARLGIYAEDDTVKITRSMPPAIRGDEWCGNSFTYQSLQKGVKTTWPETYYEWMQSDIKDRDFTDRRDIATKFREELLYAVSRMR